MTSDGTHPSNLDATQNSATLEKTLRALILFSGDGMSARDTFADANEKKIAEATETILQTRPELRGGAARNQAIKQLWDNADHEKWEVEAQLVAGDVNR